MCNYENREKAMTVIGPKIWCDPCLVPIVKALNEGGLPTIASCCGHGAVPGSVILADGRWLMILPDDDAADALYDSIAGRDGGESHG